MIRSFKSGEIEKIFHRTFSQKLPQDIQQTAFRKLRMLNRAGTLVDLRVPPAHCLEKLHNDREGQYSIRINEINGIFALSGTRMMPLMSKSLIIIKEG